MNKKVDPVGKIIDVFGPVKNPYVAIRAKPSEKKRGEPTEEEKRAFLESFVGQVMYLYRK